MMQHTMNENTTSDVAIRPFRVDIPEAALDDLRRRLAGLRWPSTELVADGSQGVQVATLQALTRYWATEHDWRTTEAKLNGLPQFTTTIDGLDIHFIHVRSPHPNALPMIVTHGWPGSVLELLGVVGPLTDPTAHGGHAEDAFDLVLPSLPGYGFSAQPTALGWNPGRVAGAWGVLMQRLGYTRYVAQGGDQGANVTDAMARLAPDGLLGVHFNFLSALPLEVLAAIFGGGPGPEGLLKRVGVAIVAWRAEKEAAAFSAVEALFMRGYLAEMLEHPQTVGYAQADSPAALAAWMLDHDPDSYAKIARAFLDGQPSGGLTPESVVDNVALYWLTNTGVSSARLYWELGQAISAAAGKQPAPPALPVAFTVFPGEIFQAPRSWVEKVYPNLIYFNEVDKGGHFAAWEEPQLFAEELRAAFRPLRQAGSS